MTIAERNMQFSPSNSSCSRSWIGARLYVEAPELPASVARPFVRIVNGCRDEHAPRRRLNRAAGRSPTLHFESSNSIGIDDGSQTRATGYRDAAIGTDANGLGQEEVAPLDGPSGWIVGK